jgi:Zn finger protein HypA/HybF involved in hydrogenase expression
MTLVLVAPLINKLNFQIDMHDLHVADLIHRQVMKTAKQNNLKKVDKILIELGTVIEHGAAINVDNLEYNLGMLNEGTMAADAKIEKNKE